MDAQKTYKACGGTVTAFAFPSQTVAERIADALRRWVGDMRAPAKQIASRIEAHPRTAENWLYARCAPTAADLIALMRESDEVFQAVCEMAKRSPSLSADAIADIEAAVKILRGDDGINTDRMAPLQRGRDEP